MHKLLFLLALFLSYPSYAQESEYDIKVVAEFSVGDSVGLLRAMPVQISPGQPGILTVYSADKDIDPFVEMFYLPTDPLKFVLFDHQGQEIWRKELGPGTINGIWFTPIFPFDLDNDGSDEIYYVHNNSDIHPLGISHYRLRALSSKDGAVLRETEWPRTLSRHNSLSSQFRHFIMGGYVDDTPVLLTAQGTYQDMAIQAWDVDLKKRWDKYIEAEDGFQSPRGSHQTPLVDINHDGIDELMWGERCLSVDNGEYLFIGDETVYNGHSDVIQPTLSRETDDWYIFTCRETGDRGQIKPRVVMFNNQGERVWTDLELGHMDMGWTAHPREGETWAFTISRGDKTAGPEGFFRHDVKEFAYSAFDGKRIDLPFSAYNTVPVDLNGDGYHEFACAQGEQADRNIYLASGEVVGNVGEKGYVAMACQFLDLPGEQLLCYYPDGTIKIFADRNAKDSPVAKERYNTSFYDINRRMTGNGYNLLNLGGI